MPGFTATNLGKSSGSLTSSIMFKMVRPMQQSAKKGSRNIRLPSLLKRSWGCNGKMLRQEEGNKNVPCIIRRRTAETLVEQDGEHAGLARAERQGNHGVYDDITSVWRDLSRFFLPNMIDTIIDSEAPQHHLSKCAHNERVETWCFFFQTAKLEKLCVEVCTQ